MDANDTPIRIEDRDTAHSLGLWHRVVHVLLYNSEGELMLQMRAPKISIYPNRWDCSCSEHLKPGESWETAARRGLEEELGITGVDLIKLLHCRANYGDEGNVISMIFTCVTDNVPVNIDKNEVSRCEFFKESTVKAMLIENESAFAVWTAEQLKWKLGMPNKLELIDREVRWV